MAYWNARKHSSTSSREFLRECKNVNQLYDVGFGPRYKGGAIHLVVDEGWMEALEVLIQKGANVNLHDNLPIKRYFSVNVGERVLYWDTDRGNMFTPLMRAIWHWPRPNGLSIIKFLLENGADPNYSCPITGILTIDLAVVCLNMPAVDLLVKEYKVRLGSKILLAACTCIIGGAAPYLAYYFPKTPEQHACRCQRISSSYGGFPSFSPQPHENLSVAECVPLVEVLLENGAPVEWNALPIQSILLNLPNFNTKILNLLFAKGMIVNAVQRYTNRYLPAAETVFCKSFLYKKSKVNHVRWLIRHGAVTNMVCPDNCFDLALSEKNYELFELLLHAGLMPNRSTIKRIQQATSSSGCWALPDKQNNANRFSVEQISVFYGFPRLLKYATQGSDLLEFSDETLQTFPESDNTNDTSRKTQNTEEDEVQMRQIMTLLSQPPSLKWRCRQYYRNIMVLGNSIARVKALHLPTSLKRYLLCHDV